MSLKENIDMVKEELSQEEKMFESAVKTEKFVKKYKMPSIGAITTILVVVIGNSLYKASVESKITASNKAYSTLLQTPTDASAQKELQENNALLYDAWKLQQALKANDDKALESLKSSKSEVVSDIASYELATLKQDSSALNSYSNDKDAIYRDIALLNEAVLLMKNGKKDEAKARLSMIDDKSSLKKTAMMLQHYGVK